MIPFLSRHVAVTLTRWLLAAVAVSGVAPTEAESAAAQRVCVCGVHRKPFASTAANVMAVGRCAHIALHTWTSHCCCASMRSLDRLQVLNCSCLRAHPRLTHTNASTRFSAAVHRCLSLSWLSLLPAWSLTLQLRQHPITHIHWSSWRSKEPHSTALCLGVTAVATTGVQPSPHRHGPGCCPAPQSLCLGPHSHSCRRMGLRRQANHNQEPRWMRRWRCLFLVGK